MSTKTKRFGITDTILLVVSASYYLLLLTVFKPCGPKEDGSFMVCQWSWRAVLVLAALTLILSIVRFVIAENNIRLGLSIAILSQSVAAIFIPGTIIPLCMMESMRCHEYTKQGNFVLAILIAAAAVVDIVLKVKAKYSKKK
ncbi:MAG: DUF4418 family protein [Lachnospiraceae bacterium]|nr:DUF4418 family protein [Lachnospiraceae bacterium]